MKNLSSLAIALISLGSVSAAEAFIGVFVVESEHREGYSRIHNEKVEVDGFIAPLPDSKITTVENAFSKPPHEVTTRSETGEKKGAYTTTGHELTAKLGEADHLAFGEVTKTAHGKKILLRFAAEDRLAMADHQPIPKGMFAFSGVEEKQATRLLEVLQSLDKLKIEQAGAGQPATRTESKPESDRKPELKSEERCR